MRVCPYHGEPITRDSHAWWLSLNWLDERLQGKLERTSSLSDVDAEVQSDGVAHRGRRFYDNAGRVLFIETKRTDESLQEGQRKAQANLSAKPQCAYVSLFGETERQFRVMVAGYTSWARSFASMVPVNGWMDADSFATIVRAWWYTA